MRLLLAHAKHCPAAEFRWTTLLKRWCYSSFRPLASLPGNLLFLFAFTWAHSTLCAQFSLHVEGKLFQEGQDNSLNLPSGYVFSVDVEGQKWRAKVSPIDPDYASRPVKIQNTQAFVMVPDEVVGSSDEKFFYCYIKT